MGCRLPALATASGFPGPFAFSDDGEVEGGFHAEIPLLAKGARSGGPPAAACQSWLKILVSLAEKWGMGDVTGGGRATVS